MTVCSLSEAVVLQRSGQGSFRAGRGECLLEIGLEGAELVVDGVGKEGGLERERSDCTIVILARRSP